MITNFEEADEFIVACESRWPIDEATSEAEHFVVTVLQKFDCRTFDLDEKLFRTLQYWERVFENETFLRVFINEFNKRVPEWCSFTQEMIEKVVKQQDLFN